MSIKHYFANMRVAEKFAKGKSANVLQNVRLDGLFQNLKKSYMRFFLSFRGPLSSLCIFLMFHHYFYNRHYYHQNQFHAFIIISIIIIIIIITLFDLIIFIVTMMVIFCFQESQDQFWK